MELFKLHSEEVPMWSWLDDSLQALRDDLNEISVRMLPAGARADMLISKMEYFAEDLIDLMDLSESILKRAQVLVR